MIKKGMLAVLLIVVGVLGQAHLNPDNFPEAMSCDITGKVEEYENIWRGITPIKFGWGPADIDGNFLEPVIDGFLEDSIWMHAETLLINSWDDVNKGYERVCQAPEGLFNGPLDMHAIWRVFYTDEALYISCEIHDDIIDVDSIGGWYLQDGIEISIDPWDWGDYAAGNWTSDPGTFRRYYSSMREVQVGGNVGDDNSHMTFLHILKRLNVGESAFAGMVGGIHQANYNRGEEYTNFVLGDDKAKGIEFATQVMEGGDAWGRTVVHTEWKFPFHGDLWGTTLEPLGYFANDLPIPGTRLKLDFFNNEDDIPGPDGAGSTSHQMGLRKDGIFIDNQDALNHWSQTKWYQTFQYDNTIHTRVPVNYGGNIHGHKRLKGLWVSLDETIRYALNDAGVVDTQLYSGLNYYDSIAGLDDSGLVTTSSGTEVGTYKYISTGTPIKDTLVFYNAIGGTQKLLPYLPRGYKAYLGRYVQARLDTIQDACGNQKLRWVPRAGAREYRFCPLSQLDTLHVKDPRFPGDHSDSVRVYDYETGACIESFSFTKDKIILSRDVVEATLYGPTKFVVDPKVRGPNNLQIKYSSTSSHSGDIDTLVSMGTYSARHLGEGGGAQIRNLNWKRQTATWWSGSGSGTSTRTR